jgi:lipopolysaccharide/colanic/teichoic acid biosynthesis glycosyltransferase
MKRGFDLVVASLGLALLSPLFLLIALAVKLDSPGPVFYRQIRVGKAEVLFRVLKFRSMFNDVGKSGRLVTVMGDPRITRFGRVMRKWKLDELPQLINVISGNMSLVGPRPEVSEYLDCYSPQQREVLFSVKPGITDLAAIEYRDEEMILARAADPEKTYREVILPKKYELYERYISERDFWLDLQLILETIWRIFCR